MRKKENTSSKLNITRRSALVGMAGAAGTIIAKSASGKEIQVSSDRPYAPEDPSKVTVPEREIKVSLLLQLPATLILRLSVDTSNVPSVIVRLPLTSKIASKAIDPDELRVRL